LKISQSLWRNAGLVAVLAAHLIIFGFILVDADFLPFAIDNNESFAAWWHARNMHAYGFASTSGLADESFSYDRAAHPFLYSHSGASPRLFAYLLFALGARTVELQIVLTVLTIGTATIWLAYRFLDEIAGATFALTACLLLMSDYLLFTQWHLVLWQIWRALYVFGGLALAQRVVTRRMPWPVLAIWAFHVALFYYETVFNVFVAATLFLYVAFTVRRIRSTMSFGVAQLAGAVTAAAILTWQDVSQLGWDVFVADATFTFVGRNFASDPAAFLRVAMAFYAEHNLVFWPNVPDTSQYRTVGSFIRLLFQDHAMHSAPWSLIVLAFAAAEVVRAARRRYGIVQTSAQRLAGICLFLLIALASLQLQPLLYTPASQPAWMAALGDFPGLSATIVAFCAGMVLLAALRAFDTTQDDPPTDRLFLAIAAILAAFCLTYIPFAGYIHTAYAGRYPLTIYLTCLVASLGLVAMINSVRAWRGAMRVVATAGLVAMVLYWINLQGFYFRRTPPDTISFLTRLREEPFRGRSFIGLAHGGLVSYFTGQWAYFDFNSTVAGSATGAPLTVDRTYAWFADRLQNRAYARPEYFIAMTYLGAGYATEMAAARPRVGDIPLIASIRRGSADRPRHIEVLRDPSGLDRWSIVRLDWD
jgi:hypothetical protein